MIGFLAVEESFEIKRTSPTWLGSHFFSNTNYQRSAFSRKPSAGSSVTLVQRTGQEWVKVDGSPVTSTASPSPAVTSFKADEAK
jgi:hypothetical protein